MSWDAPAACRHGLSTKDQDAWNCAYYEDPAHQVPAGPGRKRGVHPDRDCQHGCNGDCVENGSEVCNFTCHRGEQ